MDLAQWHGKDVIVEYESTDGSQIWVKDLEGRLITTAQFEGNKRAYFEQSYVDQSREKRAEGRLKRLEIKADSVKAELNQDARKQALADEDRLAYLEATMAEKQWEEAQEEPLSFSELMDQKEQEPLFDYEWQRIEWLKKRELKHG